MIAALLLIASLQQAREQPAIKGVVVDAKTNAPIHDAKIDVIEAPLTTKTGADGRFEFAHVPPGEYTLTVASHDPDGVWHDWLEDAVAFSVSDTRYTAGVANLHAQVSLLARG